ncbi:hypothetical protein GZ77_19100 [Endozoicomonas montiporae]|uniref:Uncharacterized protein n=2 Tax=Endozoicomonas montiporae TaxID=1027273 RepID=A0A081N2D8_9GAMM|nr:AlpA family phage regulatory protein [Endozoicomonas montiporae]AMO58425.1 phage transcriptional regulator AlpA [Endozoicomonas montiporae CL-33]KEQ12611.1 hypothetical protein GZ77_19100 [Endozoicomonas montiporae]
MDYELINIDEVLKMTTLSRATIYRLIKQKQFPEGYIIASKRRVWKRDDVSRAIESMLTGLG